MKRSVSATVRLSAFIFSVSFLLSNSVRAEFRTWTDSTGKNTLEAEFVSVTGNKVKLKSTAGKFFEIELDKLSEADRKFVSEQESNPFKSAGDSPFMPADGKGGAKPQPGSPVDWSNSTALTLLTASEDWSFRPGEPATLGFAPKPVQLPPKTEFFEKMEGLVVSVPAKRAVVGYVHSTFREDNPQTRLLVCDLEKGRGVGGTSAKANAVPIAFHDDGEQILMRPNSGRRGGRSGDAEPATLEIWKLSGKEVSKQAEWVPYPDLNRDQGTVNWAEFVDANTLATCSKSGRLAIWDFASLQPVCHLELNDEAKPALSPDRKVIGFCGKGTMGILDIARREVIGTGSYKTHAPWPVCAFSPSGNTLVCVGHSVVMIWDMQTGQMINEFKIDGIHVGGAVDFPGENFLLLGKQYLFDIQNQLKLWQYTGAGQTLSVAGTTFFAVDGGGPGLLFGGKLPHPEAEKVLDEALKKSDLFVFRPGLGVKLDVSKIPADKQEQVKSGLTKQLAAIDVKVGGEGFCTVVASLDGPKQRTVSYIGHGDYDVQETHTKVEIVFDGKPIWSRASGNVPFFISIGKGENIEGKLREHTKEPTWGFYNSVEFPKFIQKPSQGTGGFGDFIGKSNITTAGLR